MKQLLGRRALVCGASQGIGAATAAVLAEAGAQVILLARNQANLDSVLRDLPGSDHKALAVDIGQPSQVTALIQRELEAGPIHILINNTAGPKSGLLLEAQSDEFLEAFRNHILSAQNFTQLLVPGMRKAGWGRIVNIISTSVKTPIPNLGVSNTIRGAMANWAKTMSLELGPFGITVNNVLPGYTMTPRLEYLRKATAGKLNISEIELEKQWLATIPMARLGHPLDIAKAVGFLAGVDAGYITGINLPVDGGRTPSL